jgi:hypothetical protein
MMIWSWGCQRSSCLLFWLVWSKISLTKGNIWNSWKLIQKSYKYANVCIDGVMLTAPQLLFLGPKRYIVENATPITICMSRVKEYFQLSISGVL